MVEEYKRLFQMKELSENDINDLLTFGMITKAEKEEIIEGA
ncbi:hypothetical protein RD055328_08250 [Companilactobacillus sp. RD055328]|nr:hypothetical protein RD055328_08250 [Companilactobacillus sp. RD055328]